MEKYAMYLRKSRADEELERMGDGDTLARHRKALTELAKRQKLVVTEVYEEVVSGESIAVRPQMQKLLAAVEQGMYAGVLVMEVERLARGDTMDQGLVSQTFKYSDTLIITPSKTYNPNNEFDEEYFEFGLFMSRREYKTINRRLQRGREASVREGNYIASRAPYGYKRKKLEGEKGATLEIISEQAEVVRLIFDMYVNGIETDGERKQVGIQSIARQLNNMGIPSYRHDYWQKETIRSIISNPTYAGLIRWGYRRTKKTITDGKAVTTRPITDNECIIADGKHEAIIEREIFNRAQEILSKAPPMPVGAKKEIQSPLSGLVRCAVCGRKMVIRKPTTKGKPPYLVCHARSCSNVSAPLPMVEQRMLSLLHSWANDYRVRQTPQEIESTAACEKNLQSVKKELKNLEKQLNNAFDLVERGIYSDEVFTKRHIELQERIAATKESKNKISAELEAIKERNQIRVQFVPKIEALLEVYDALPSPAAKNQMLKEIIEKAVYHKEYSGAYKGHSADDFSLVAYPALPKSDS